MDASPPFPSQTTVERARTACAATAPGRHDPARRPSPQCRDAATVGVRPVSRSRAGGPRPPRRPARQGAVQVGGSRETPAAALAKGDSGITPQPRGFRPAALGGPHEFNLGLVDRSFHRVPAVAARR